MMNMFPYSVKIEYAMSIYFESVPYGYLMSMLPQRVQTEYVMSIFP